MGCAYPWWLAGAGVVLGLAVGYVVAQRRTGRHTRRFAHFEVLERVAPMRPGRWRHVPAAVILVGLVLLAVAMPPRRPGSRGTGLP